jgi:hypothetical protein
MTSCTFICFPFLAQFSPNQSEHCHRRHRYSQRWIPPPVATNRETDIPIVIGVGIEKAHTEDALKMTFKISINEPAVNKIWETYTK